MSFVKIIETIENELHIAYMPGAIQYIDKNYDDAWSKAIDAFEAAINSKNEDKIRIEGEIYKQTIVYLIGIYKQYKRGSKIDEFLNSFTS
jgi:hypothetical protein